MANMSYCRFENTANDLADCLATLENSDDNLDEFAMNLSSRYERTTLHRLIGLCQGIVNVAKIMEDRGDG